MSDDLKFPRWETSKNYIADLFLGMTEKTVKQSSMDPDSFDNPFNSDDLYQKKGDYTIYEEMVKDDQVYANLQLKKDMVLGSGWDIIIEDEGQEEIRDQLSMMLSEETKRPFDEMLEEILSAYEFGFSISEKLFKKRDDGSVQLHDLKTRHPNTWRIPQKENGDVEKFVQIGKSTDVELDPKAVLHYVNQPKFQNPYGRSDLRPAYQAWFTKTHITRYYAIYLEKAASPTPVGRYDKNAPQTAIDKIFNALKKLQAKTALVIPKDIETEFLEAKTNGEAFIKGISIFNLFIGRSLLLPDLIGLTGSETSGGSFSLGKEQLRIFFNHIGRRRKSLECLVNQEIIKPLVITNFGDVENFPKWKLRDINEDDIQEFTRLWLDAVKGNVFKPNPEEVNHFRSLVKFPEGDVLEQEPPPSPFDPNNPIDPNNPENGPDIDPNDDEATNPTDDLIDDLDKMSSFNKRKFQKEFMTAPGEFSKKTDFKVIETELDRTQNAIIQDATPIMQEIIDDLLSKIEKKDIVGKQKITQIENLKATKFSKLKPILNRASKELFRQGSSIARTELSKSGKKEFQELPLPDEKFLDVITLENLQAIEKWKFAMEEKVRVKALNAIRDGKPLNIPSIRKELKDLSDIQVERWARTKSTEIMNRGRLAVFNDNEFIESYQFSAILDDRVSDICAGLHGKIFSKGDQPVPPLHFNCRSQLVPITRFEQHTIDDKPNSSVPLKGKKSRSVDVKKNESLNGFLNRKLNETGFSKF